jgi:predicted ATPase/DNA-binding CsgD family transcriptional regulator
MSEQLESVGEHLYEQLTERELAIVRLIGDGLSNQEIADTLFVELSTIKWYNTQIFGKLQVKNRKGAVKRATELNLFGTAYDRPKHNLPTDITPFIGRESDRLRLDDLLNGQDKRLITILGSGGMGKTRLSITFARDQINHFGDGVYFIPLAPLTTFQHILPTIADAIGLRFHGEKSPQQQLLDYVQSKQLLLVMDNFEHVLEGATIVTEILRRAPSVKVLATSREKLNLQGETIYAIRGMAFPDWETPETVLDYDAVRLFMTGAQRTVPDFALNPEDLPYLVRISRLVGGMPLGVVLASAWVDVLTLAEIADEIGKGLDLLESEVRDVPSRHQSIRAAFEHSWQRLTEKQQNVFMKLAVFRGGFTREAGQHIADANIRALQSLVNKSLLVHLPSGRYEIHELLRQYAEEKLQESGHFAAISERHGRYFADFMWQHKTSTKGHRQLQMLHEIEADFENVRVAWLVLVDQSELDELGKFLDSLWFFIDLRTRGREGLELCEYALQHLQTLASSEAVELARGRILARLAWFYNDAGFTEKSKATGEEAIQILRRYDSPEDLMAALYGRSLSATFLNEFAIVRQIAQEGAEIARLVQDKSWEGLFLVHLSYAFAMNPAADPAIALEFMLPHIPLFEEMEHLQGLMYGYANLGTLNVRLGNYDEAEQWLHRGRVVAETLGNAFIISECEIYLGAARIAQQRYDEVFGHLQAALQELWEAGYKRYAVQPIAYMAKLFAEQNDLENAVEILALVMGKLNLSLTQQMAQTLYDQLQATLEPVRFETAWERGKQQHLETVILGLLETQKQHDHE